jgi:hypothetical protein
MLRFLLALSLILPILPAAAQEEGEVIVIAELSRSEVTQFLEEAEDQFYAIFNANVEEDDYEINCRMEKPTGSNISIRMCEPTFMIKARAENANLIGFNPAAIVPDRAIRSGLEPEYNRLQEKMEQMTQDIPEFAQIASILAQLRARRDQLTN